MRLKRSSSSPISHQAEVRYRPVRIQHGYVLTVLPAVGFVAGNVVSETCHYARGSEGTLTKAAKWVWGLFGSSNSAEEAPPVASPYATQGPGATEELGNNEAPDSNEESNNNEEPGNNEEPDSNEEPDNNDEPDNDTDDSGSDDGQNNDGQDSDSTETTNNPMDDGQGGNDEEALQSHWPMHQQT